MAWKDDIGVERGHKAWKVNIRLGGELKARIVDIGVEIGYWFGKGTLVWPPDMGLVRC